jgi:hypothetical protein
MFVKHLTVPLPKRISPEQFFCFGKWTNYNVKPTFKVTPHCFAFIGVVIMLSTITQIAVAQNNCSSATYPAIFASSAIDEDITNVTVGAMNNPSVCGFLAPGAGSIASRYSNYTGAIAGPSASPGSLVPFSLTMTTCGGSFNNFFQIYVDWNRDSDFLDAGEQVYSQPAAVVGNQTTPAGSFFTVPITATIGTTRMRVVNVETTVLTTNYASTAYTWGETEDYCFTVIPAAPCSGVPNAGTATISASSGCASTNFTLSANGLSTDAGITYQWQSSSSSTGPWTNIAGATSPTLTTSTSSNTFYQLITTCANSGLTNVTSTVSYSVNTCPLTITLTDSFSDGWDGATMTLNVNGVPFAVIGENFTDGASQTINFCLPQNANYSLVFTNSGAFPNEVGVSLTVNGNPVYQLPFNSAPSVGAVLYTGTTCPSSPPVPVNDLVCNATTISCGQTLAGTTVGASLSGIWEGQSCGTITPATPGVWYVVAGNGQIMTASLCGAAWDSQIQIFAGPNCTTLTCFGGNNNGGPACAGTSASVQWTSAVGLNYYIFVSGLTSVSAFNLALTCAIPPPPPANDLVCNATLIACGQTIAGTTVNATITVANELNSCTINNTQPAVWYRIVGNGQLMTASLCGTAWDSRIRVFSGTCSSLTCVGGNNDSGPSCGGTSTAASHQWLSAVGVEYFISVSGTTAASAFSLVVSCQTVSGCSGTFTDPGPGANYPPNQYVTTTYCPGNGGRVSLSFSAFDLENGFDYLTVFDGPSTSSTVIGSFTGTELLGLTISASSSNPSGCLTFLFESDGSGNRPGWVANLSCLAPCQLIQSSLVSSSPVQTGGVIRICQGQSVTLTGAGSFSASPLNANYSWSFNNGAPVSGQSITQTFNTAGTYLANLNIQDPSGCRNSNRLNVRIEVSTTPTISTSSMPSDICLGQSSQLNSSVTMTPNVQSCTPPLLDPTFLPDGANVSYEAPIVVDCYSSNQVIQSVSDISSICLNMEHSSLADLDIQIQCPNGSIATLFDNADVGLSSANLGQPVSSGTFDLTLPNPLTPGVGSVYCFSGDGALPTIAQSIIAEGVFPDYNGPQPTYTDEYVPGGASLTYEASGGLTPLLGCPLNGQWSIIITDNIRYDNGYVFNWDINFTNAIASSLNFTPTIVGQGWQATSGLTTTTGSSTATVTPTVAGSNCYTYSVTDNFGCTYNQQACVNVINNITATVNSATICSGASATITATPVPAGTYNYAWTVPSGATNPGNVASFNATVAGTYTVVISTQTTPACASAPASGTLTVGATMTATSVAPNATICLNQALSPNIVFTTTGATGIGAVNLPAGLVATFAGNATAGTVTISGTPTSTLGSPFAYSVALSGGCGTVNAEGTITINNPPSVTANSVNFNSVCAGPIASESATPTITLTLNPSTAIANWSLYAGTTATGVPIQTGTGNPNYAFTNSTCSNESYVYRVIPTLNGCNGAPLDISITVKPKPLSSFTISPNPICVGQTATLTYTSPTCPTSSFNWQGKSSPASNWTTLAAAGLNPSTTNAATLTITPSTAGTFKIRVQSTVSTGCTGPMSDSLSFVVNPIPTATITGPTSVCSGNATALNLTSTPAGATFNWTQTATNVSGSSNGTGASINQALSNTGSVNGSVQYVVTPTLSGCPGPTANTTVNVLQLPTASLVSPNNVCPGTSNPIIIQGTAGAQVTVVNGADTDVITIPPGGQISLSPNFYSWTTWPNGMNLVFTQVATTSAPICTAPLNIVVTANPTATASISIALTAGTNPSCAGGSMTFTATPTNGGTLPQYQWQVNGVNAGTNSPTFTSTSLTNGQVVTCVLTSNAACLVSNTATSNPITITINPTPIASVLPTSIICTGNATALTLSSNPSGANFTWTQVSTNVTGASNGSGSNIVQTLSASGATTGTVVYTIIPTLGTCLGSAVTSTVTVAPVNTVGTPSSSPTLCLNSALTPITIITTGATGIGTPTGLPSGVTATWGVNVITISGTPSESGTFNYSIPLTGGCGEINASGTIVVSDIIDYANLQFPGAGTICANSTFNAFGQLYNTGAVNTPGAGAATGVTVQIGYSTTNSDPSTWTNWSAANYNPAVTGNNDEYQGTLSGLAVGTYYYTFRYQINGCAWQYGGYSASGGGFWNGTCTNCNVNGQLNVIAIPDAGNDATLNLCANGTTLNLYNSLGALAANTGVWTGPSSLTGGYLGTFNPASNTAGVYKYKVSNGTCADSAFVTVVIGAAPSATLTYSSPVCATAPLSLSPIIVGSTGPNPQFAISPTTGVSIGATTGVVTSSGNPTPGTYTVTYTIPTNATTGCTAFVTTAQIVVTAAPAVPTLTPASFCANTPLTFIAGNGSVYEFFVNGVSQGTPSSTATFNSAGVAAGVPVCVRSYPQVPVLDGNIVGDAAVWGAPLATSAGGAVSTTGNRIDGLFLRNMNNVLYGAVAGAEIDGTTQAQNNRVLLFLDTKPGMGFNSLAAWTERNGVPVGAPAFQDGIKNLSSGITFDTGFAPDYILAMNCANSNTPSTAYFDLYDMNNDVNVYLGSGTNVAGAYGYQANAAAGALDKGFEFGVPMALIGSPTGSFKVFAMLVNDPNSTNPTTVSNQFLTRANPGQNDFGSGNIDFNNEPPNPIVFALGSDCYTETCVSGTAPTIPEFGTLGPFCNEALINLPSISNNNISGSWSQESAGSNTYIFTPTVSGPPSCASTQIETISILPQILTTLIFHN